MKTISKQKIRELVLANYRNIALKDDSNKYDHSSCCHDLDEELNVRSHKLGYSKTEITSVPKGANLGIGCGNPSAIASLKKGETVLDLGSGGGFDCFLASSGVGETGKVIGVDMTPEMVSKARNNAIKGNFKNVEFRLGEIENLPIADESIDVIISNCVINLSPEKEKVFKEAYRVLKPGGRLAIADVVTIAELPEEIKNDATNIGGCISGASTIELIHAILKNSGFSKIKIENKDKSREFIKDWRPGLKLEEFIISATIEAIKEV